MKLAAMIKKMCPGEAELSIPAKNCYRMVILGSSKVGKTAIVSRFLTGRFEEQYTPTIEDFHRKFYSIRGEVYQLDILDTSGNHPFPAMRRLSILTGTWLGSTGRKGWRGVPCLISGFLAQFGDVSPVLGGGRWDFVRGRNGQLCSLHGADGRMRGRGPARSFPLRVSA